MDVLRIVFPPLHREGPKFVAIFLVLTLIAFLIWTPIGWAGVVLTVWCYFFFRDPDRMTPTRAGLVVAPADGVICQICDAVPPPELGMAATEMTRIAIFMNVFNCHVTRAPIDCTIEATAYRPGKFINASLDKASEDNERMAYRMRDGAGLELVLVQIAGLVARRIVADGREGRPLKAGERIGIIRFGSRVDLYLPQGSRPLVAVGQTMIGGETVLADLSSSEATREAAIR